MKLSELNPRWSIGGSWVEPNGTIYFIHLNDTQGREKMGLTFDCPVHRTHRLAVFFDNPVDGRPPERAKYLWHRTGEDFDTMTLTPSINAQGWHPDCWHGFIADGVIK